MDADQIASERAKILKEKNLEHIAREYPVIQKKYIETSISVVVVVNNFWEFINGFYLNLGYLVDSDFVYEILITIRLPKNFFSKTPRSDILDILSTLEVIPKVLISIGSDEKLEGFVYYDLVRNSNYANLFKFHQSSVLHSKTAFEMLVEKFRDYGIKDNKCAMMMLGEEFVNTYFRSYKINPNDVIIACQKDMLIYDFPNFCALFLNVSIDVMEAELKKEKARREEELKVNEELRQRELLLRMMVNAQNMDKMREEKIKSGEIVKL